MQSIRSESVSNWDPVLRASSPLAATSGRRPYSLTIPSAWVAVLLVFAFAVAGTAADERTQQAWLLADQARELARSGTAESALPVYGQALALAPGLVEIRRDYAVALAWAEHFSEAGAQFQLVLEAKPEQPDWVWREVARVALLAGHPEAALPFLDRLIERGDESEKTLAAKALALRRTERHEEAQALYRYISEIYPESSTGAVGVVQSLADQAQFTAALSAANEALEARPGDGNLLRAKAQVLNWLRRYDEARTVFSSLPSESVDRAVMGGWLLAVFSSTDASRTVRDLQTLAESLAGTQEVGGPDASLALSANPLDLQQARAAAPWAYADVARELARSGATGEALALYRMALDLAPEEIALRRDYAVVLGWADRYAEAEKEFTRLLVSDPNPPEWVLREMARTKLFGGNPKGAIHCARQDDCSWQYIRGNAQPQSAGTTLERPKRQGGGSLSPDRREISALFDGRHRHDSVARRPEPLRRGAGSGQPRAARNTR
jgi:tetratricopeptide (TPR) repeat protein